MDSKAEAIVKIAVKTLDENKAQDIKALDISEISTLADSFIIASGNSDRQVKALKDYVENKLAKEGYEPLNIEGYDLANWILMDYGDVVIHIFDEESRAYFDLEHTWRDAKVVEG